MLDMLNVLEAAVRALLLVERTPHPAQCVLLSGWSVDLKKVASCAVGPGTRETALPIQLCLVTWSRDLVCREETGSKGGEDVEEDPPGSVLEICRPTPCLLASTVLELSGY